MPDRFHLLIYLCIYTEPTKFTTMQVNVNRDFPYVDDFICMVEHARQAQCILNLLLKRFAKFELELHPDKTLVISFGRFERKHASEQNRRRNTFDFLGFMKSSKSNTKIPVATKIFFEAFISQCISYPPYNNGCTERFIRTLKENLLWVQTFETVEELRLALLEFKKNYNEKWIIERLGYKTPAQARTDTCNPPHKVV